LEASVARQVRDAEVLEERLVAAMVDPDLLEQVGIVRHYLQGAAARIAERLRPRL
jgi:hypothetical protein